jgi:lysophospholipase L1-like esterase
MRQTLALVLVAMLACAAGRAAPIDRFESDIRAYEAKPLPPPGGTLFLGSSTFTRWTTLEREFAKWHAVNRAFGGSTIPEITFYADRIVFPYRPATIVFYAGTNDVADGHSARQVCDDFKAFVRKVRTRLPDVRIIFVSMNMPPSRVRFASVYEEGNRSIARWIGTQPHLDYLDLASLTLDAAGMPQPALYTSDMLHMNEQGYARWILPIQEALSKGP